MHVPMLAKSTKVEDLDKYAGWVAEPKHDGMRAIVEVSDGAVEIYSRTGKPQTGKCPNLEAQLAALPDGVYDGELGVLDHYSYIDGAKVPIINFNKTMRVLGSGVEKAATKEIETQVSFLPFDCIMLGAQNERWAALGAALAGAGHLIEPPVYFHKDFRTIYHEIILAGGEGLIIKNTIGEYVEAGRTSNWLKVKSAKTFDVVISGFTDGKGKYEGKIGAIEFGAYFPDGGFAYVGRCSGMTDEEHDYYTDIRDGKGIIDTPIVIEVKANDMVGSGEYRTPRHPQYVTQRADKNPEDCLMDQFKS